MNAPLTSTLPLELRASSDRDGGTAGVPRISAPLLGWFTWYSQRYLRRHFHSLRVARAGLPAVAPGLPLVVYGNHASWWDALVGLVVKAHLFPDRTGYGPIDAEALQKYKMFGRLGFFGVERASRRGAVQFLRTAESVLKKPEALLVVTPQGRFADARERPVQFEAGLGHLAARVNSAVFQPMATEYVFWEERLPEILVRFGEPVHVSASHTADFDAKQWKTFFEQKLEFTQDTLASQAQRREPDEFEILLHGGAGQGGFYDWWRAAKARLRGQTFRKEHGTK